MDNMNVLNTKYSAYIRQKIQSAKESADILSADIENNGIAGSIKEIALQKCLMPFLTQSYKAGNGKIIDSFQKTSSQIDILLYHKKVAPPILINSELGLYPIECVKYAFEIKSKLTATEIKDSIEKFKSVAALNSFPSKKNNGEMVFGDRPTTVLFAFNSDITGSEIKRYIKYDNSSTPACMALCVLGKGYWFYQNGWYGYESDGSLPAYSEFCMFIAGLMNTLSREETSIKPFNPGCYLTSEDVFFKKVPF
ncbi:DUF6602 domain-containing protein [Pectobacterium versatile]|uniref:DUF6602 domain-containing protein n=1 Tax=Pectobacterium versatile TaxID=2488639 RepID=UPI001CCC77CB|nr:DUF6602 domain-containing protein [Pectobacterium versatile]